MQNNKPYKLLNIVFCIVAGLMLAAALMFFIVACVKKINNLFIGSYVLCGIELLLIVAYVIFVHYKWGK